MAIQSMIKLPLKTKQASRWAWTTLLTLMLILCLGHSPALAEEGIAPVAGTSPYPTLDMGYVTDFAKVLNQKQEQELENLLNKTETDTGLEMAVVIINSINDYPGTANESIEAFATGLFNDYGIGNMPQDNGILLLVSVKDRKARIALGASFGHRYDAKCRSIMDNVIVPKFKRNDYPGGIRDGVKACLKSFGIKPPKPNPAPVTTVTKPDTSIPVEIAQSDLPAMAIPAPLETQRLQNAIVNQRLNTHTLQSIPGNNRHTTSVSPGPVIFFFIAMLVVVLISISLFRSGKRGWGWAFTGIGIILFVTVLRMLAQGSSQRSSRRTMLQNNDDDFSQINNLHNNHIHNNGFQNSGFGIGSFGGGLGGSRHNNSFGGHSGGSSFGGHSSGGFGGGGFGGGSSHGGGASGSW